MSDLEAVGNPDHVCDEGCAPYMPLAFQELEELDESDHIDALYDVLDTTREHAALMLLALSRVDVEVVRIPARAAAFLLDMDEEVIRNELGPDQPYAVRDVVDLSIRLEEENGYMGRAMAAIFRLELNGVNES